MQENRNSYNALIMLGKTKTLNFVFGRIIWSFCTNLPPSYAEALFLIQYEETSFELNKIQWNKPSKCIAVHIVENWMGQSLYQ